MPYGVLIVTGGMTHQENYARGFQEDPRCRIVAVADEATVDARRESLNRKLAAELQVPYIPDLPRALADRAVDIASICTEHHRQGRVGIQCAEAGKHIYMDKPVAGSLDEARRIEATLTRTGRKSQMFSQVLFPWSQRIRRALISGRVGDLRAIHCDLHFAKGYAADFPISPRRENPVPVSFLVQDAKREMFNIAVYSLALFRWLTQRKRFETVHAFTANYFFEQNRARDFEDFAILTVGMEGGVTATISAGRTGWRSHGIGGTNQTKIIGTRGTLFLDGADARGEICGDGQPQWESPEENVADPMAFWASSDQRKTGGPQWFALPATGPSDQAAFVDCIEKDREPEVTVADGVRILEVLFAAYRSAATGDVVRL
ncbi:MAG: Gfo/Idh/MocA family oxidoreductase [Bryobacteraceae bacterium]